MLDFYNRTTPKARKEYKCDMCGENEFDWDWITDWWREHYCPVGKHRFTPCNSKGCYLDPKKCSPYPILGAVQTTNVTSWTRCAGVRYLRKM